MGNDAVNPFTWIVNPLAGAVDTGTRMLTAEGQDPNQMPAPPAAPDLEAIDRAKALADANAAGKGRASTILTGYQGLGGSGNSPSKPSRSLMGV